MVDLKKMYGIFHQGQGDIRETCPFEANYKINTANAMFPILGSIPLGLETSIYFFFFLKETLQIYEHPTEPFSLFYLKSSKITENGTTLSFADPGLCPPPPILFICLTDKNHK